MKNKILLILIVLIAASLVGCDVLNPTPEPTAQAGASGTSISTPIEEQAVIAEGFIVPQDSAALGFPTGGTVVEVLVEEGDFIQAGAVLARLGETEQILASIEATALEKLQAQQALKTLNDTAALATAQAAQAWLAAQQNVIAAERTLASVDTTAYQEELDNALIEANDLKDALDTAQEEFDKVADLATDNPTRTAAEDILDTARTDYEESARRYRELQLALDTAQAGLVLAQAAAADAEQKAIELQDGPDPDQGALLEARISAAEAQLVALNAQLDNLAITAPFAGTVVKVNIAVNDRAAPGSPAFVMADFSSWYVETDDLTEMEVVEITTGEPVSIEADALPGKFFTGVVEKISDIAETKRGDVTYTARILLDDTDLALRWGMSVVVTFK